MSTKEYKDLMQKRHKTLADKAKLAYYHPEGDIE